MHQAYGVSSETAGPAPSKIGFTHAFEMHYKLIGPIDFGIAANGRRVLFTTDGGIFEGPKIRGVILPGGSDWALTGANGASQLDVNIALKAENGDLIHGRWTGFMHTEPEIAMCIPFAEKRATMDPSRVYFRVAPMFETASTQHAWLARNLFVASAQFTRDGISYRVMKVD